MRNFLLIGFALTLSACTTLSPEKVTARVDAMNSFQLCLADQTGLGQSTYELEPPVRRAAQERIQNQKIDCTKHQDEIIRFLTTALQQEQRRNDQLRLSPRPGYWRFW